ncbi:hypothetical protein GL58_14785 [Comamonas testosteroni]|uniref:YetF C-terminal domain-containing protein n=1 Tax=Comamonas testosteroni TaxID=285 RepID=A0A0L7MFR0_COMTE|nr:YetF domain-containing protein [Comamonas testosteroni]KOC20737.1 hypothetical protein GL58_14785 [Comamonas testosteroni]KWT73718.1 hypothetical protein APV28_1117 [Comamonas testosteroni]
MFSMAAPWWEFVIRGVSVYLFLLVFLRLTGRRQTGQYAPFDLVLLLILSNAVQNSMNAGDNSLIGGLISATTLLACHALLSHLSYRFAGLRRLVNGKPKVLIHQGIVQPSLMTQEQITAEDLAAALRSNGCLNAHEVERATIETNGQITVVLRKRSMAELGEA